MNKNRHLSLFKSDFQHLALIITNDCNCSLTSAQLLYFFLCTMGLVISAVVIAFQCYHYALTNRYSCKEMGEYCMCTLDPEDPIARTFSYSGVTDCSAIVSTLPMYYLLQMMLNLAQAIVCLVGAFLIWKHRYQVFFAGLQTGSPSVQTWQKV